MYFNEFEIKNTILVRDVDDLINISSNSLIELQNDIVLDRKIDIKNVNNIIFKGTHKITLLKDTTIKFKNCTNILIKDIIFVGHEIPNKHGEISLQIWNSNQVDIINSIFINGEDEQLCIKHGSDYVYIEKCKFLFTSRRYHAYAILIGYKLEDKPTSGYFHVTLYQCIFDNGNGRYPRCRNTELKLINCYWSRRCHDILVKAEKCLIDIYECHVDSRARLVFNFAGETNNHKSVEGYEIIDKTELLEILNKTKDLLNLNKLY